MKTVSYNPSKIEVRFAKAVVSLLDQIQETVKDQNVFDIAVNEEADNPTIILKMRDKDQDEHELIITFYQSPDK